MVGAVERGLAGLGISVNDVGVSARGEGSFIVGIFWGRYLFVAVFSFFSVGVEFFFVRNLLPWCLLRLLAVGFDSCLCMLHTLIFTTGCNASWGADWFPMPAALRVAGEVIRVISHVRP
jgi:hypothetical protein